MTSESALSSSEMGTPYVQQIFGLTIGIIRLRRLLGYITLSSSAGLDCGGQCIGLCWQYSSQLQAILPYFLVTAQYSNQHGDGNSIDQGLLTSHSMRTAKGCSRACKQAVLLSRSPIRPKNVLMALSECFLMPICCSKTSLEHT